ncbi:MAG: sensor histidine kinase [Clostridium sp.]
MNSISMQSNLDLKKLSREELEKITLSLMNQNNNRENFLLNITHDLRNPINNILGVVQCINKESYENEKIFAYISMIKRNSLKMVKLVDNLIDTTRLENANYSLIKKNIDIITMIESTVAFTDKYATQKNVHLVFDTNVEECIMAVDIEAFDRIIMNLLSNAIKFTKPNTNININVFDMNNILKISIKDEGLGIKREEQEKIFSRFEQATKQKESEHCGSGIGLDLVNYLVKAHNGDIELISEEGNGAEFIITLPKGIMEEDKVEIIRRDRKVQQLEIEFSDIYL